MMESTSPGPVLEPMDEHNRALISHVHPPDWVNPEPKSRYHLVVIGAGTAGLVSAAGAAGLGAKVALIERDLMGGDCLNVGCVPSKGVIEAARAWHSVHHAKAFGAPPHIGSGNFGRAMERMRRLRATIAHNDSAARFSELGIDVFLGEGRFLSPTEIEVDGNRLTFRRAVVATGARAARLPIPGLDSVDYSTNETIFSLTTLPRRIGVIGAGPIGSELSQAFARFGSEVTVFELMPQVLSREDPDAAEIVQAALAKDGVNLALGVQIEGITGNGTEKTVTYTRDGERTAVTVDELLVSVGRAPNIESLDLERARIEYTPKGVKVDDTLRTTNPRVYACGDVASRYQFTHAADAQARIVIRNAFFFGRARASKLLIPWVTYTSPEVAHVGAYPTELDQAGVEFDTVRIDMATVDRAILDGDDAGFLKVHHDPKGNILGATVVAAHAGDLLSPLCVAMSNGVTLGQIADTIHPYPTTAEAVKKAGDAFNRTRLTPRAKRFFTWWFRLFR